MEAASVVGLLTVAGSFAPIAYRALGLIYLLGLLALSLRVGRKPVLLAAVLSALAWDYFAMPPRWTFRIENVDDAVMLVTFFVVALLAGQLTAQIRIQGQILGATREREKMLTASERMNRALFDSVSHELKTPMSALRTAVWGLQKNGGSQEVGLTDEIRRATDRMQRIVDNLLDQTRLESGTLAPALDWHDLQDIIEEVRHDLDYALHGRTLTVEIAPDTPLLRVDAYLMNRVIANLVLNAAVHTPTGSSIAIRSGVDESRIYISVSDHGPGMSAELKVHLFKKFQRGDTSQSGGLGLGLSIVNGFVSAQGGTVTYSDGPTGGAVFTVYLPIVVPESVPKE